MTLTEAKKQIKDLHQQRGIDFGSAQPPFGTLQIMGEMIGLQDCMKILDQIDVPGDGK